MRLCSLLLGWLTIVVGTTVLFGWFFDVAILKSVIPGFVTMKFSTALSFLFSGIILTIASKSSKTQHLWFDIALPSVILIMALLMGTALLSSLFGFSSGIEKLFIQERPDAALTVVPGHPSIGTMVAFIFVIVMGVIAFSESRRAMRGYLYLGSFVAFLGGVALVGYGISQPVLFYSVSGISTAMAIHTAILFICLGIGFVLVYIHHQRDTGLTGKC